MHKMVADDGQCDDHSHQDDEYHYCDKYGDAQDYKDYDQYKKGKFSLVNSKGLEVQGMVNTQLVKSTLDSVYDDNT